MKLQSLKNLRCKPLAAAVAATLLVSSTAHAAAHSTKLTLAGFTDAAEGTQLLAGDYTTVIAKLAPHSIEFSLDEVAASTNLCVAYVATGHLDAARGACDEAVKMAKLEDSGVSLAERLAHEDALSIAYANRAVLDKLSGE
jgi:hypothetical protein